MITPKFLGIIAENKILLDDQNIYDIYLPTLEGHRIELVIQKEQKEKTSQQLKYLYGVVYQMIADETGYSKDEIDHMMRFKFLKIIHKTYEQIRSPKDLTTVEMSDYIKQIKQYAAVEISLFIPEARQTSC